jgi:general secretion pathway protein N
VQLATRSGPLQLSGSGEWAAGRLRFRGQASAAPGFEAVLGNLLNIIGRRQGAVSLISIG